MYFYNLFVESKNNKIDFESNVYQWMCVSGRRFVQIYVCSRVHIKVWHLKLCWTTHICIFFKILVFKGKELVFFSPCDHYEYESPCLGTFLRIEVAGGKLTFGTQPRCSFITSGLKVCLANINMDPNRIEKGTAVLHFLV